VLLINDNTVILNEDVADMPLTFGGNAPFMIENIMAAILAAYFNRIEVGHIVNALHSFTPSYENTPGRVNMFHFKNFSIILDYAHNMHGITALGTLIRNISASFKIGIISAPGDRRDSDIMNIGKISAEIFNKIIIRVDEDPRGRKPVEIVDLLHTGIKSRNKNLPVEIIAGESDAVSYALTSAPRGSLIVHLSENIKRIHDLILEFQKRENELIRDIHDAPESPYILRLGKNNIFEYTKKKMN
jgi:cyanophycin synthetase